MFFKNIRWIGFIFLFVVFLNVKLNSQGIIYSKPVADSLFGIISESKTFQSQELRNLLLQSDEKIMFNILDGYIVILNNNRVCIYPPDFTVSENVVFRVFSISKVLELLNSGNSEITYIENRNGILTLTNSDFTLEFSLPCPPYCY